MSLRRRVHTSRIPGLCTGCARQHSSNRAHSSGGHPFLRGGRSPPSTTCQVGSGRLYRDRGRGNGSGRVVVVLE